MKKTITMMLVIILALINVFAGPQAITTGPGSASCKVVYEQKPTIKAGFYSKNFTGYTDFMAGDSFAYNMGQELAYGTDFGGGSQNVVVVAVGTNYEKGYNLTITASSLKNTAGGATDCLPYSLKVNVNKVSGTFGGTTGDSTIEFAGGNPDPNATQDIVATTNLEAIKAPAAFGYLEVTLSDMKVTDSGIVGESDPTKKFAAEFVITIANI